ncbi:hypothetical protein HOLleu_29189 [Holothuria leucospilota]|uniref:Uncharacterized protein n=1 Tax=Holothuria leucospilota TaxID=206669 RepID=A0A9Q1BND3_HOLLE|nr:hypothetical protein HOLleu_29189 [Holothuria leucospilota]
MVGCFSRFRALVGAPKTLSVTAFYDPSPSHVPHPRLPVISQTLIRCLATSPQHVLPPQTYLSRCCKLLAYVQCLHPYKNV